MDDGPSVRPALIASNANGFTRRARCFVVEQKVSGRRKKTFAFGVNVRQKFQSSGMKHTYKRIKLRNFVCFACFHTTPPKKGKSGTFDTIMS